MAWDLSLESIAMIMNRIGAREVVNCTVDPKTSQNSCGIPLLLATFNWRMAMESILVYLKSGAVPIVLSVWLVALVWKTFNRNGSPNGRSSGVYSWPPGPAKWPIFGNIPGMALAGSSSKYLKGLVERFGPVFTMHMGTRPILVLNTYDTIKDVLNDGNVVSDRADSPALDKFFQGRGVIAAQYSSGDWRTTRSFLHNAMKHFGVGRNSFDGVIASQAETLLNYIQTNYKQRPFDPQELLGASVCGVINGVVSGKRLIIEDARLTHLVRTLHSAMRASEYAALSCIIPGMQYLAKHQQFFDAMDAGINHMREEIDEHESSLDPENPRDIIDIFLCEMRRVSSDDAARRLFTKTNIAFTMFDLFIAGTETSSNVIYWLILLISSHPEVQAKIQQEIDDVTQESDQVSVSDGHMMPYTMATIEEGLRFSSVAISAMRSTTTDTTICGHHLAAGTWIMINYEYAAYDPLMWEEPESFKPERFLDEHGEFRSKNSLLTFGTGRRNCLGEKLARKEIFLFTTSILKRFHLEFPESNQNPSTDAVAGGFTRVPKNYQVCFKHRTPVIHSVQNVTSN